MFSCRSDDTAVYFTSERRGDARISAKMKRGGGVLGAPAGMRGQGRTSGFPAVVLDFTSKPAAMPGLL